MKIDSTTTAAGATNAVGGSPEARNRSSTANPPAGAAAEVHLSELAGHLQSSGEASPFDVARVAEIKQAITDGRFTINADAIADRLIASASELLGSPPPA